MTRCWESPTILLLHNVFFPRRHVLIRNHVNAVLLFTNMTILLCVSITVYSQFLPRSASINVPTQRIFWDKRDRNRASIYFLVCYTSHSRPFPVNFHSSIYWSVSSASTIFGIIENRKRSIRSHLIYLSNSLCFLFTFFFICWVPSSTLFIPALLF